MLMEHLACSTSDGEHFRCPVSVNSQSVPRRWLWVLCLVRIRKPTQESLIICQKSCPAVSHSKLRSSRGIVQGLVCQHRNSAVLEAPLPFPRQIVLESLARPGARRRSVDSISVLGLLESHWGPPLPSRTPSDSWCPRPGGSMLTRDVSMVQRLSLPSAPHHK